MKILFLGDVVGISGRSMVLSNLLSKVKDKKIDFVVANGENAADSGVGLTENICKDFFNCGVDVITTGNHVWDQKETMSHIEKENRLLRPKNLFEPSPGKGFGIFTAKNGMKVGVLNLMGNVFMKKCEDVFEEAEKFMKKNELKKSLHISSVRPTPESAAFSPFTTTKSIFSFFIFVSRLFKIIDRPEIPTTSPKKVFSFYNIFICYNII